MKIVILVDVSTPHFQQLVDKLQNKNIFVVSTEHCDEEHEYRHLLQAVEQFSASESEVMLGKFSGRASVIRELGDERPEMILAYSFNKRSQFYNSAPVTAICNLISDFERNPLIDKILA